MPFSQKKRIARPEYFRSATKAGFTLIEVLVVVAIIALLVSILLPSLTKAREQAKLTACLANLHDFGTSLHQYAMENNSYFPLKSYMGSTTSFAAGDDNMFVLWYRKYAKNINSFSCPATTFKIRVPEKVEKIPRANNMIEYKITTNGDDTRSDFREIAQNKPPPVGSNKEPGFGISYEYMAWTLCGDTDTINRWHHQYYGTVHGGQPKTTKIGKPSPHVSMLMHDADDPNANGSPNPDLPESNNYPQRWDNHGTRGMDILFADGHAVTVRPHMLGPVNSRIWNMNDCLP